MMELKASHMQDVQTQLSSGSKTAVSPQVSMVLAVSLRKAAVEKVAS